MKLTAFCYGTTEIDERMAFQDGDKQKKIPISLLFFLISTEDKQILVDVGCDTMPGFPLYTFCSPVEVLEEAGVKRTDITDIILTHTHHDHADGLRYYPQAKVYVHKTEAEAAKKYAPEPKNIVCFNDYAEIAENVVVQHIGGHSEGSSVVRVKDMVLCGDECYTRENLTLKKPTGSSFDLEKSTYFVQKYGVLKEKAILFHDLAVMSAIGNKVLLDECEENE
ncbi:MAG: MBL fold metallo-hydrolase [Clostridia bacterium]|nr:MBL fold metallo-hydrolase [Clostridia bacterium]